MIRLSPISRPSDLPVLNPLAELKPEPASPPGGPAELPLARGRERSAGSGEPGRSMPRLSASRTTGPIARSARRAALLLVAVLGTALPAAAQSVVTEVPSNWSLKPTAVTAGTQFRLLFLSSTKRDNASSTDIADYNTFVQGLAAAGHTDIQDYSAGFRAVGCTADTDARDNTSTTYTSTDKGVPIYWLNGAKAADEYEDFYDGSWDDEANDKNESGTDGPDTFFAANWPFTGCDHDGTEAFTSSNTSHALGALLVRLGQPNRSVSGDGPLSSTDLGVDVNSEPRLMYGLSAVFQVATATSVPGAPSGLTATASGTTAIDLSWTAPASTGGSAITGYKIEVAPDGTSWTDLVADTSNTTTTYAHTGLTEGDTRHYRISAINANGTGDPSNVDSATAGATTTATAPGAPTGLTATASGTTAINLSWTAPGSTGGSAITGYKIEVAPDGTSWTDLVADTSNTTTTYAHTGLTAGDIRHYRVSAINAIGTGDPSNVDSATTDATVPGAPSGLTATASGTTAIDLSWTAPASTGGSAITGYKIEVAPDGTSWTDLVADTSNTTTTYAHTGLTEGDTRHYRISAINANGTGDPSNVDSATAGATTTATAPGAPTGLTATASGTTAINLSWTAPGSTGGSAITGYKIEVAPDGTSWTDLVADTSNTTTTYAHTGLTAGDIRHYRVSAINAIGTGDPSNVDSATTDATVPGAPSGLTATASGTTAIDLSWTAPGSTGGSAITGYKIEVAPDGTSWTDLVADTSNTTTTYAHTGLTAGDIRHYRVSAINAIGTGDPSNVDSATTDATVPGAPSGLTATASGTTAIDLSWTAPGSTGGSAITGYKIEVAPDGTSWTDLVADTSNTTTTYAHTGLTAGDTRHYRVSAINTNGTGTASNVDSATTATSAPGTPTGLSTVPMLGGWPMLLMGALMLLIAAWRLRMQ